MNLETQIFGETANDVENERVNFESMRSYLKICFMH